MTILLFFQFSCLFISCLIAVSRTSNYVLNTANSNLTSINRRQPLYGLINKWIIALANYGQLWSLPNPLENYLKKKIDVAQNIFSGFIKNYILSSDLLTNILGYHRNSFLEYLLNICYVCTWHSTMYRGYICKEEGNLYSNSLVAHYLFIYYVFVCLFWIAIIINLF